MNSDFLFLTSCCKTNPTAVDIKQIRTYLSQSNDLQIHNLVALSHQQAVFPLFYQATHQYASDLFSESLNEELKSYLRAIVMKNMQMTSELLRLTKLLKQNGIDSIAFKGPALAQVAYGDITNRQYGDLDILIKGQDIPRSLTTLKKDGYISEIILPSETTDTFFACVNVIGLNKKSRIEIHWELLSKNYAIDWKESQLWGGSDTVTIYDKSIPILPFNTQLLYLCAHGAKHQFELFQWVCDIDRFIKANSNIDWNSLLQEAKSLGVVRMLLLGLNLCKILLSLELPEEIITKINTDKNVNQLTQEIITLQYSGDPRPEKTYSTFTLLWRMRENLGDRLRFAYRAMFAPKFDDFVFIQLPKPLLFLYPLIRPFRLVKKYFQ